MKPFTTVHVDDQVESLNLFKKISSEINSIELAGSFLNARDALDFINHHQVDLVFIDVVMPTPYNGLWLANELLNKNTAIAFITAYAEHATTAFEACALDFILKPVTLEILENTVYRIRQRLQTIKRLQKEQISELHNNYLDESNFPKRLFINAHGLINVVNLKEVTYLKSVSNYTTIKMVDGQTYIASKNLKVYDEAIHANPDFLRIHRSAIINKNFVKAILRKGHKASVLMVDDEVLELSQRKKDLILEKLTK